jgi:DNA adenine methylase
MTSDVEAAPPALTPIFRWPGGKRWLLPQLLRLIPPNFDGRYYEPFFGGGALFFALRPARAVLSDKNHELMDAYRVVRDDHVALEDALRQMPRGPEAYYAIRDSRPTAPVDRAARLLYLTTNGFNGIHRVNRAGEFNVPYGGRTYARLGAEGSLSEYSRALGGAQVVDGDFASVVSAARPGDLVYLDPPYTVAHTNNGFRKYNSRVFLWEDQLRLAAVAHRLASRGVHVIISNADHDNISSLYGSLPRLMVSRHSAMAPDPKRRKRVSEAIYSNLLPVTPAT